jgi:hypothetical protein
MPREARACPTALLLCSVFVALLVFASLPAHAQTQRVPLVPARLANATQEQPSGFSSGPKTTLPPGIPASTSSNSSYDEQLGMTFTQSFTSMLYNVTAVEQTDPTSGAGPAYLLNGLSDQGYWYQVGLVWNWPNSPGVGALCPCAAGWHMVYEVFNSSGDSIFPSATNSGLLTFSGPVSQGDSVALNLYFSSNQVVMLAQDQSTGAQASETYSAEGATSFVGLSSTTGNSNGFFTGLMTEWYHPNAYYGGEQEVTYSSTFALSSASMWMDEWNFTSGSVTLFDVNSGLLSYSNPTQLQEFSSNGATEYSDAYSFISGGSATVPPSQEVGLTLGYSVIGGGTGYSPPVLTYIQGGSSLTATLTTTPTKYMADKGSAWSVSQALPGGSGVQEWTTNQITGGTISQTLSESFVYYHDYALTVSYSVIGGGTPDAPEITGTQYGVAFGVRLVSQSDTLWLDSGSSWTVGITLGGSNAQERWQTNSTAAGTVIGPSEASLEYYRQFGLTFSYSITGGGNAPAPLLDGSMFGRAFSTQLTSSPTTVFLDAGTNWTVPSVLEGSSPGERWITALSDSGTSSGASTMAFSFQHQYYLNESLGPPSGGSMTNSTGWYNAGASVQLSATPNGGWKFVGWKGSGNGSYTGEASQTSMQVTGSTSENATFFPGMTITSGADGKVSYSYGRQNGTVPSGTSLTIYAPVGTAISLKSNPSLFVYKFNAWSPSSVGSLGQATIILGSPLQVGASFSVNFLVVVGILVVIGAIAIGLVIVLKRRPKSSKESPPASYDRANQGEVLSLPEGKAADQAPSSPQLGSALQIKFCQFCGAKMLKTGTHCPSCGKQQPW